MILSSQQPEIVTSLKAPTPDLCLTVLPTSCSHGCVTARHMAATALKISAAWQVAGVDLEQLIRETKSGWTKDQPIADFSAGTERIQIYLDGLA